MVSINIKANLREPDAYGEGHFGASRGRRKHKGLDFACAVGSTVCSTVKGEVTNLGYTYRDDLSYRYVQVTCDKTGRLHRFFYVEPSVEMGVIVVIGDPLGTTQALSPRYPNGITEHFHYEIMYIENKQRKYEDPGEFLAKIF